MSHARLPAGPKFSLRQQWLYTRQPRRYSAWLRRRYGDVATLSLLGSRCVMTFTPEGARQVFTANADDYGAFLKDGFAAMAGAGSLWVLEGQRHRRERKLLMPAFHAYSIPRYGQVMRGVALAQTDRWQAGQELRAYDAMLEISRDVVLRAVLGLSEGPLLDEGRNALKLVLHSAHPFVAFVPALHAWWFPPWARFQRARQKTWTYLKRCVAERRASGIEAQDVLGLLLAARYDDGTPMHDDDINAELGTVLMSGHETTAVALAWALYELGRHPEVLKRLREELDALGPDAAPDLVVKQPYLGAVCDETLRLHTVLTEVGRVADAPCELLGHRIPAGVAVAVSMSAIHQDPAVHPEPERFLPDRFLERTYGPFEFLPFGGGHRRCLGAAFQDYEMRIALATIVTRWDFEIVGKEDEIRHNIGTGPKYGVRMRVKRRRSLATTDECATAVRPISFSEAV
jgi:cytochrome P450 family 110